MTTYIVAEGEAREYDPSHLPPRDAYGTDWIIVSASNEADALEQARQYDARCHPAQIEMELYAALYRAEPPLLATGDVAHLAGVTPDAVRQWVKRYPEFRALAHETSGGLIWHESDVLDWLRRTGRMKKWPGGGTPPRSEDTHTPPGDIGAGCRFRDAMVLRYPYWE